MHSEKSETACMSLEGMVKGLVALLFPHLFSNVTTSHPAAAPEQKTQGRRPSYAPVLPWLNKYHSVPAKIYKQSALK